MSQKTKKKTIARMPRTGESQLCVVITVGWALVVVVMTVAELAAVTVWFFRAAFSDKTTFEALFGMLSFTAVVLAILSLVLLPVMKRLQQITPTPTGCIVFSCVIAALSLGLIWLDR